MTGPAPRRRLTPDQYDYLRTEKGWSDEELQKNGLDLPATKSLGTAAFPWKQEAVEGGSGWARPTGADQPVTTLPPGSSQPLRQESGLEHGLGLARNAVQGATGNWYDELAGLTGLSGDALGALFEGKAKIPNFEQVLGAYRKHRDSERAAQQDYESQHPIEGGLAKTLGGAATAAGGFFTAPAAVASELIPTAVQTIAKGAAAGGGYSGAAGLGAGEGPAGDQVVSALEQGKTGLMLGAAIPAGVMGAKIAAPFAHDLITLPGTLGRLARGGSAVNKLMTRPPPSLGRVVGEIAPTETPAASPAAMNTQVAAAKAALRKMGTAEADIPAALAKMKFPEADPAIQRQALETMLTGESPVIPETLARKQAGHSDAWLARRNQLQGINQPASEPTMTEAEYRAVTSDPANLGTLLAASLEQLKRTGRSGSIGSLRPLPKRP